MITAKALVHFFARYEAPDPTFIKFGDPEASGYFRRLGKALLLEFFPESNRDTPVVSTYPIGGGFVQIGNKKALNKTIAPVKIITIEQFYPTLLAQLIGEGLLSCNCPELLTVYAALVEHRVQGKAALLSTQYLHWKAFLNMFYGMTQHETAYFRVGGLELVGVRSRAMWDKFLDEFREDIAYVRTDTAYARFGPDDQNARFYYFFVGAGLTVDIEHAERAIFLDSDRSIIWTKAGIKSYRLPNWK